MNLEQPTPKDHIRWFKEFVKYEMMTGGPDPHMKAVVELSKDLPLKEKFWRAALYVGVYNVPSAEAIWRNLKVGEINVST